MLRSSATRSLIALACVAGALGCGARESGGLARVRKSGVLRWGGDIQGGEPYAFEDPQRPGRIMGFEVDIADALARALGVRARFVQNDWSNLVPSLERGSFDVAMNGLEVTPARAARIRFTRPYYIFTERLAGGPAFRPAPRLSALRGRRVGTLASSRAWDMLREAGATAVPYEGVDEPYQDLSSGRLDAVLLDDVIADRYAPRHVGVRIVGDVGEGYYSIGVRKGEPDLADAVDRALQKLATSGELRRILARWEIDNERQARLAGWLPRDTDRMVGVARREHLTVGQAVLFLQGAVVTLLVSTAAMLLAIGLGMSLALTRLYGPSWAGFLCTAYVELLRGTPVLLQLYVIYFALAPVLQLDAYTAAVLGLGLNYAAYEAEVYRAGIQAVPRGQMEAALSLGMSRGLALRRVVLPQALRVALPNVTNDFIALLKDSSLVSVITVVELTKRMTITSVDVGSWLAPGMLCAGLYFFMSYPLARLARRMERRLERS